MYMKIVYFVLIFYMYNMHCQADDKCNFHTCGECISYALEKCVWCAEDRNMSFRCQPESDLNTTKTWCDAKYIVNPQPVVNVTVDKQFNETIEGVRVQLRPQRLHIKTRPGHNVPLTMYFEPAKDYPLDVYYLIDISYTMKQKKKDLQEQAEEIYRELNTYTNNVRLGIGSFVEKPGFPYVDKIKTQQPQKSHSFRHHLSLTSDPNAFKSTINKIEFGANYDNPEAGLDALMQAMTCLDELGWRSGARRIIVLCTDSTYHSAGDGKIVGAIKPNDMKCHLKNNVYSEAMALTYDYPSISQINKMAIEGQFIIVFAATRQVFKEYTNLANHILGANYAVLESKTDAVKIIKEAYLEYSTKGQLVYNLPEFIQLTVDQDCKKKPATNCASTPEQRTVKIEGNLTVKYCPPDGIMRKHLTVSAIGIKDYITIELDIDCQCDCEKEDGIGTRACNWAGFTQCGICKCNPGRYGDDCRCNGTSVDNINSEKCKLNETDKLLCSGRGTCRCGKCELCNKGFSGTFCEFDDSACQRYNNKLCSDNGICYRGKCNCNSGWTDEDCSCKIDKSTCFAPYSKEICSGNGKCSCGRCECGPLRDKIGTYSGIYCDLCDDCAEKRCKDFEEYVHCNVVNSTKLCNELHTHNTTDTTTTLVTFKNKTELDDLEWNMAQLCKKHLENGSSIIFKYQYIEGNLVLGIQKELEGPPTINVLIAVASAVGGVLFIGILTLIIWKILIDYHDKKEYENFAKEAQENGFEVRRNDLYQPPKTTFINPSFDTT